MQNKKSIILTIVAVATLIALVVGATFAYFQAQGGTGASADVRVTTYTTDLLTFTTGSDIAIYADQANFADGLGNQTGETFARAHLLANNKTNTATANYYVYLNVTNNTFEYTQEDETAELLLQVTDPNGTEVTTLSGLEYKTVTDGKGAEVKGFDVTTFDGLVTIANNYEIVANNETTQTWTVELVFVNLDADQTANAGNGLSASLIIQKEAESTSLGTIADWVTSQYTGTQGENNLYYHDSTLANGANDNSYRYAGSSATTNNYVCFGSDAETCPDDNLYRIIGVFDGRVRLIKADYATTALLGTDTSDYSNSYSGAGWSASYYKGSMDTSTIGAYYWNKANYSASYSATNYYNDWSCSELNKTHLNTNFLANIGTTWANMIDKTTWKVGGFASTNVVPSTLYTNEITSPSTQVASTYESKVGLMYVSDYAFAAAPTAWTTTPYNYEGNDASGNKITEENWMYMGLWEWTMARSSSYSYFAGRVYDSGWVEIDNNGGNVNNNALGARPVFHLTSKVEVLEGDGTLGSPLKISDGA